MRVCRFSVLRWAVAVAVGIVAAIAVPISPAAGTDGGSDAPSPEVAILSGPSGPTADPTPSFSYTLVDEGAGFECSLDEAAFSTCPAGEVSLAQLPEGEHTFEVRSKADPEAPAAETTFVLDTSPPETPELAGGAFEGSADPWLRIDASDADGTGIASAELSIDGRPEVSLPNACGPDGLCPDRLIREYQLDPEAASGTHAYSLTVTDAAGQETTTEWDRTLAASTLSTTVVATECKPRVKLDHVTTYRSALAGCDEEIISVTGVKKIDAGPGNDVVRGGPGGETIRGGTGTDIIWGARNNDHLYGEAGGDTLYGGTGDDKLKGDKGSEAFNDVLDGGPGGDTEWGGEGTDTIRGGQGGDHLHGEGAIDFLSLADTFAPGYPLDSNHGVVGGINGRLDRSTGVYVKLGAGEADNGNIEAGRGGVDDFNGFEKIIGSAFDDVFVGDPGAVTTLIPGPGADVIANGAEKAQVLGLTANEDFREGEAERKVTPPSGLRLGIQNAVEGSGSLTDIYLSDLGTPNTDPNSKTTVTVRQNRGNIQLTVSPNVVVAHPNCSVEKKTYTCKLTRPLGAIVVAPGPGEDTVRTANRKLGSAGSLTLLGGPDGDVLGGGNWEETLLDGEGTAGTDTLTGGGSDDVLLQGEGADVLRGSSGNDLLVSSEVCGNSINGKGGADNAQFHTFKRSDGTGVFASIKTEKLAALLPTGEHPECGSSLVKIEDLEGSPQPDSFEGSASTNNLMLGRGKADTLIDGGTGGAHLDNIKAKDGALDKLIECDNNPHLTVSADKGIEIERKANAAGVQEWVPAKEALATGHFKECGSSKFTPIGTVYDDINGSASASAAGAPTPERFESLLGAEATEPPEQWSEALEPRAVLADYMAFDESEGTIAYNSGEPGFDGTYQASGGGAGPTLKAAGALLEGAGSAVQLDGVNDMIGLPESIGLGQVAGGTAEGFTLEMFVRFSTAPSRIETLFSAGSGPRGLFLTRSATGTLTLATGLEAGAPQVSSYKAVTDTAWHQVDAVVEAKTLSLYLDGVAARVTYPTNVLPGPESLKAPFRIGASPGPQKFLAATVDEYSTFGGPLSDGEVLSHLMETTILPPASTPANGNLADTDGDSIRDTEDNCPTLSNAGQADVDFDGVGDACLPPDSDGDEITDAADNCPDVYNPSQADANGDGVGDACVDLPPFDAITEGADQLRPTSAVLHGQVVPGGGQTTTYRFQYGTTESYGSSVPVPAATIASGAKPIAVSKTAASLVPATTYHYRLVATNENGETYGDDKTFVTPSRSIPEALEALPVVEPFDGSEASLSRFSSQWQPLGWVYSKGVDSNSPQGWGPLNVYPKIDGAYRNVKFADSGTGIATVATLNAAPLNIERYFSLWLGLTTPTEKKPNGYELEIESTPKADTYEARLMTWEAGFGYTEATTGDLYLPPGSRFAIVCKESVLSAWVKTPGEATFYRVFAATENPCQAGYAGLEGAGNLTRLKDFAAGPLPG